jgi:hypothetical protein
VMPAPRSIYLGFKCSVTSVSELSNSASYDLEIFSQWQADVSSDQHELQKAAGKGVMGGYRPVQKDDVAWVPEFIFFKHKESVLTEESYYRNPQTSMCFCIMNWHITFDENLNLRLFPFDRQLLEVQFVLKGVVEILPFTSDIGKPESLCDHMGSGVMAMIQGSSWQLIRVEVLSEQQSESDHPECTASLTLFAERSSFFYVINFGVVLFLLLCCALGVVRIDRRELADRMGVTINLLLTLVAFKFVMTSYIPPTSYLTLMDKYMLLTISLLALIIFENFTASVYGEDVWDEKIFFQLVAFFWIAFHAYVVIGYSRGWFLIDWNDIKKAKRLLQDSWLDTFTFNDSSYPRPLSCGHSTKLKSS